MLLNIYRIQTEDDSTDVYNGFIILAENETIAKQLALHQVSLHYIDWPSDLYRDSDAFLRSFTNRDETEARINAAIGKYPHHQEELNLELARWTDVIVELVGQATDSMQSPCILLASYLTS